MHQLHGTSAGWAPRDLVTSDIVIRSRTERSYSRPYQVRVVLTCVGVAAVVFHLLVGRGHWVDGRVNALTVIMACVWSAPFIAYLFMARSIVQSLATGLGGVVLTIGLLQYVYRVDSSTAALGIFGLLPVQYGAIAVLWAVSGAMS